MQLKTVLAAVMGIAVFSAGSAQAKELSDWYFTGSLGGSISMNEDVTIKDTGGDIEIKDAELKTKPFTAPPYYAVKIGKNLHGNWEGYALEFEHIHQKIYIDDLPADVQHYEITDGFNLFYLNLKRELGDGYAVRAGAGFVLAHPQITVRNTETYTQGGGALPIGEGYQVAGPSMQIAAEKSFEINKNWALVPEVKLTYSPNAKIDLENGSTELSNTAVHFLLGMRYQFNASDDRKSSVAEKKGPAKHFIGYDTYQLNGNEGGAFKYHYRINELYGVELGVHTNYIEGALAGEDSKWHPYQSYSLGVNRTLADLGGFATMSATLGLEYMDKADDISTADATTNIFGQMNLDVPFGFSDQKNWMARFALGSTGKGETADLINDKPDYGHGFFTNIGVYYGF
ncbi:hypothetical protein [Thiomicrorhabdus xiamenensis]|uniref:Outer membrane protein beta-barrel domain-containing protein n=1 Tax=Thiomicrorhabdus xiamenensis TaxID=2739063 RepID=A0A7D4SIV3_9GAMM|nr:hypothetical protein [Thiomicrorhabdus xiamenensis]QKI90100.1 hypothetical protein HQN79_11205 [Thiomicrorhabdus xiamenensis]